MSSEPQVALLRGINVGGHHVVPMADLRTALEHAGLSDVRTYIQSGNVVFRAGDRDPEATVRAVIRGTFGFDVPVIVRSLDEVERIVGAHPGVGGEVPSRWLLVFLLDRPADADDAPDPERFGDDRFVVDGREVYATYPNGVGRSKLTLDVVQRSFGVVATARNLSTLAAIVSLGRRL